MKILAGVLALGLCSGAQEYDKAKHHWARWKVDSFSRYTMKIEAGGMSFDGEFKSTLTELKEKEYTARHVSSFMGATQEENETETLGEKKGEETLKVGEKEHKCVVWATSGKRGEKDLSARIWVSGVSESPLKMTWKAGDDDSGEVVATKLSDKVSAAGKEFDAVLLEGEMTVSNLGAMKGKMWMHPSVPGGLVRMELESADAKVVIDLAEFDAKK